MSPRFRPEAARAKLRRFWDRVTPSRSARRRPLPQPSPNRTVMPPSVFVELRFRDGSGAVIDPRSPDAEALQQLAAQLRRSGR